MLSVPQNSTEGADIAAGLAAVRARIAIAVGAAGRSEDSVTLLAVSKGHGAPRIRAAADLGLRDFGENYVAEALPKIQALAGRGLTWHFIGRVQANKTALLARHFDWVHGVDRATVAARLSAQRATDAPPLNICLQVNVLGEVSKAGVSPADLPALLDATRDLPALSLRGLMCMLPYGADEAEQARGFGGLQALFHAARRRGFALDTLSMGMSADLESAIAHGATLLRVGTALFGARE